MKTKIFFVSFLAILVNLGCEDEAETKGTINGDYVGNWYKTFFAQYDSSECAGDDYMGGGEDTTKSTFFSLFEDGTTLTTDTWSCQTPDNVDNDMCNGTWSSSGNSITLGSGGFNLTYTVTETDGVLKMTRELTGYSDVNQENPMCQLYEYTKMDN